LNVAIAILAKSLEKAGKSKREKEGNRVIGMLGAGWNLVGCREVIGGHGEGQPRLRAPGKTKGKPVPGKTGVRKPVSDHFMACGPVQLRLRGWKDRLGWLRMV
jgi:hypothetical protein